MTVANETRRTTIPVPHGRLEALYRPHPEPRFATVVCHPHPAYGGTMNNNVVYRAARVLHAAGAAVLRFNFRGVGQSTGQYSGGSGELDDAARALAWLQAENPGLPLWMGGVSFGARVGLALGAQDPRVQRLLGISLAIRELDMSFLAGTAKPRAFVQGELDELSSGAEVRGFVEALPGPHHLIVVPGASHLFTGQLDTLEQAVTDAVAWLAAAA